MMKLVEMKCKNCGATLKVASNARDVLCQFCGTEFKIDDEVQHVQYDNMEQSGYEFERGRIRAQQESMPKPKKKITIRTIIAWIFLFPFFIMYYMFKYIVKLVIYLVNKNKKI